MWNLFLNKARVETFKEIIGVVLYEFITDTGEKINTTEPVYLNRQIAYLDIIEKRFYFANEYQTKYITCTKWYWKKSVFFCRNLSIKHTCIMAKLYD